MRLYEVLNLSEVQRDGRYKNFTTITQIQLRIFQTYSFHLEKRKKNRKPSVEPSRPQNCPVMPCSTERRSILSTEPKSPKSSKTSTFVSGFLRHGVVVKCSSRHAATQGQRSLILREQKLYESRSVKAGLTAWHYHNLTESSPIQISGRIDICAWIFEGSVQWTAGIAMSASIWTNIMVDVYSE